MELKNSYETMAGEGLKTAVEVSLHGVARSRIGCTLLEAYAFGKLGRIVDPALVTSVGGLEFENPVGVGAGWDKKGRAVRGLYQLGFAAVEIGTVPPFPQDGNSRPRLWTIDESHSVAINNFGFNTPGIEGVEPYLETAQHLPLIVGLNVGRNRRTPNELAHEDHARVISQLGGYAGYIVLGISSPGTEDLRSLQDKQYFRNLLQTAREAMGEPKPLLVKVDSERTKQQLNDMIEVGLEEEITGFVATNSYQGFDLKAKYGQRWANQPGGLSGADPNYRSKSTATVRHIYEEAGDKLEIIGVGAIDSPAAALEKIKAGASFTQVVTAIRPSRGKVAAQINRGLLRQIELDNVRTVRDYIGADTRRGAKAS